MLGLGGYSSSEDEAPEDAPGPAPVAAGSDSDGDSDSSGSSGSVDSATRRAEEAAARCQNFGDKAREAGQGAVGGDEAGLPSALDIFGEVAGRPKFLDPSATRQIARHKEHGATSAPPVAAAAKGPDPSAVPGPDFDISRLAPKAKQRVCGRDVNEKREAGVIEGKAKRYKQEAANAPQYTDAQIALAGGKLLSDSKPAPGQATESMGVSDFLSKGLGAAKLPRHKQDRVEKEKAKRALGQSSVHGWKSEAEMVLRQQYD